MKNKVISILLLLLSLFAFGINLNSARAYYYTSKGNSFFKDENFEEARKNYELSLKLKNNPNVKKNIIKSFYEEKKYKEVIENESKEEKIVTSEKTESTGDTENGIEISNDVIAVIAGVAVSEVQGVASMSGSFAGGITEVLSGKKNMAKGIKVEKTDNKAKIDVNIIVEYGSRIPDVAYEIQNRVKKAVEGMTGFKVEEVNVHVQGVDTNVSKSEYSEEKQETKESEDIENK